MLERWVFRGTKAPDPLFLAKSGNGSVTPLLPFGTTSLCAVVLDETIQIPQSGDLSNPLANRESDPATVRRPVNVMINKL